MLCRERYRLELHWDSIEYHNDYTALLKGAYFFGPALKIAQKIEAPDFIDLDLTPQHIYVLNSYYVVRLNWKSVNYKEDKIYLGEAIVTNDYLKSLHKLEQNDYIEINTEKHEEETHAYHLVYSSKVMKNNKEEYKYSKK